MSYTSAVQMAVVRVLSAEGKMSLPGARGRFVGGPLVWDEENSRFRDYIVWEPTQAQLDIMTDDELELYETLSGVVYEPALKAVMLAWQVVPRDIDLDFWLGPERLDRATGRMVRPRSLPGDPTGGMWRIIQPGGNPDTTLLQQFNTRPDVSYELTSYGSLEQDPAFCVRMYREASYTPQQAGEGLPYIYTGVSFGGGWHIRFPKWRPAELHRLVSGKWKLQSTRDWSGEELYGDSYGAKELALTVMCLDGAILIKSSLHGGDGAWVQELPARTKVAAAPVTFMGNGGAAYFGLNEVGFARGWWNGLTARSRADLDGRPAAMPTAIATGSKPAGTQAQALMIDDKGRTVTTPRQQFWPALRLVSEEGKRSPVVRLAGLDFAPETTAPALEWLEIADGDFIDATGGWRLDIKARTVRQQFDLKLKNDQGQYAHFKANRMLALDVGRPGSEAAGMGSSWSLGEPKRRFTSLVEIVDASRQGYSNKVLNLRTLGLISELEQVEIGWRPPLDGLTVAQAIRKILDWCNIAPGQIGLIHDSGRKLPESAFGTQRLLDQMSSEVRGALDQDSGAACQLREDLSGLAALQWCCQFDYNTFLVEDEQGRINYVPPGTTPVRSFTAVADLVAENEVRKEVTFRPRLGEGATSVRVGGRERSTGRPLASRAYDREALRVTTSARFRGLDTLHRVDDERLIKQALCDQRCRFEYEWMRRLADGGSFTVIGQQLFPLWMVEVGGARYWVVNTEERISRPKPGEAATWEMGVDLVAVTA